MDRLWWSIWNSKYRVCLSASNWSVFGRNEQYRINSLVLPHYQTISKADRKFAIQIPAGRREREQIFMANCDLHRSNVGATSHVWSSWLWFVLARPFRLFEGDNFCDRLSIRYLCRQSERLNSALSIACIIFFITGLLTAQLFWFLCKHPIKVLM